jgi:hypothetical protein
MTHDEQVPCVAYLETESNDIMFGCEGTLGWSIAALPIDGYLPSEPDLAISEGDEFFISFYNKTSKDLMLASKRKDSDAWEIITVDDGGTTASGGSDDVGHASSVEVGGDGSIHISYYDATHRTLKYARGF